MAHFGKLKKKKEGKGKIKRGHSRIFLRDDDHTLKALVLANDTDLTHCK